MNRGSILIARKITGSSTWIRHPLYLKVWVWILERASHKDHQRNGHQYKRGEFVTTYDEMTRAAAYYHNRKYILPTVKQIRVILAWFQKEEMITFEPIKGTGANPLNSGLGLTVADPRAQTGAYIGIRIIVINYDTYQNMQSYKGRHQGRPSSEQGHDNKYGTNMVKNPPETIRSRNQNVL